MPLVLVEWVDSSLPASGWRFLEDDQSEAKPIKCRSVGWLLKDAPDFKVIAPHVGYGDNHEPYQGSGDIAIPCRCILRLIELGERGKPLKPSGKRIARSQQLVDIPDVIRNPGGHCRCDPQ